jgi:hypothetical protein
MLGLARVSWLVPAVLALAGCAATVEADDPAMRRSSAYPQPFHLFPLLRLDNPYLVSTVSLIAKTGTRAEKRAAAERLERLADEVASEEWRQAERPRVHAMRMNAIGGNLTSDERALDQWQRRHLARLYEGLAQLGGDPVIDYCLAVLDSAKRRPSEQELALATLGQLGQTKRSTAPNAWQIPPTMPANPAPSALGAAPARPPIDPEKPIVTGANIANVDEVVAAMRPYFKQCYEQALAQEGRFGAWIILDTRVSGEGAVLDVTGKGEVSVTMMGCLRYVVLHARFAPTSGGEALVQIPLSFTVGAQYP